jgi:hypothetical protein
MYNVATTDVNINGSSSLLGDKIDRNLFHKAALYKKHRIHLGGACNQANELNLGNKDFRKVYFFKRILKRIICAQGQHSKLFFVYVKAIPN